MYQINEPNSNRLQQYYAAYGGRISLTMKDWADGRISGPITLGKSSAIHLILKVQPGSYTHQFLLKYSNPINLKRLLCGSPSELVDIICEVNANLLPASLWKRRLFVMDWKNHTVCSWGTDAQNIPYVDHFNEILYRIFVGDYFETKLDKMRFVEQCGIKICPYCGISPIPLVNQPSKHIKPPLDHFLPKRQYPFLGMSYYNLIPSCDRCNKVGAKGTYDPITDDLLQWKIYNPYIFIDSDLQFSFKYNGRGIYDENNYKVLLTAKNDLLDEGYCTQLALRPIYEGEQLQVKDMFVNFHMNSGKFFLIKLGLPKSFFNNLPSLVIGHPLDGRAYERAYYKFKADIYQYTIATFKKYNIL